MMGLNEFYRFYKKDLFYFYTQYSIIPLFHVDLQCCASVKEKIISIGCRIYEMFINYIERGDGRI